MMNGALRDEEDMRKQSEEDPGVKDVGNDGGDFCFRQGCSTGSQMSIRKLGVTACEMCVYVCVCVCVPWFI